jgi:hypothetical protein
MHFGNFDSNNVFLALKNMNFENMFLTKVIKKIMWSKAWMNINIHDLGLKCNKKMFIFNT